MQIFEHNFLSPTGQATDHAQDTHIINEGVELRERGVRLHEIVTDRSDLLLRVCFGQIASRGTVMQCVQHR